MTLEQLTKRLVYIANDIDSNNRTHWQINEDILQTAKVDSKTMANGDPIASQGILDDLHLTIQWLEVLVNKQTTNIERTCELVKPTCSEMETCVKGN